MEDLKILRCCASCMRFISKNCAPDTKNPLDPEYAKDCEAYKQIPPSMLFKIKDDIPHVYNYLTKDGLILGE